MKNKTDQTPQSLGSFSFKGKGVAALLERGPSLIDNGVGKKKKTTKND